MNYSTFTKLCIVFVFSLIGCSSVDRSEDYQGLERIHPTEITRFDQFGEHYLSFIGIQTIVLEDGSFYLLTETTLH